MERLTFEKALQLYRSASTQTLRMMGTSRTGDLFGNKRTYMRYYLLNYSNQCAYRCAFCGFRAGEEQKPWRLEYDDVRQTLEQYEADGGDAVMFQGSCDDAVEDFGWYLDYVSAISGNHPSLTVFGASPTEVLFWAKKYRMPAERVLSELRSVGLRGLAAAGAEIADEKIRKEICPEKPDFSQWLDLMEAAGEAGMGASASLMYGTLDGLGEHDAVKCRLDHLHRLRECQDRGRAKFHAFVAWPYQPVRKKLRTKPADYEEYVRLMCLARLYLDNFPSLQSSYLSLNREQFGESLGYAVNCAGGVLYTPEKVTGAAGANPNHLTVEGMKEWIRSAGFEPVFKKHPLSGRK